MQKTIAEIRLNAIRHNALAFRRRCKKLYAVVKADAYGHGAEEVTACLADVADGFVVSLLDEAAELRVAACGKDILVLTPPWQAEQAHSLVVNGFIATVDGLDSAKRLAQVCAQSQIPVRAHIKVNTGMNRYGAEQAELIPLCRFLQSQPYIKAEGVYSHLYACDRQASAAQLAQFRRAERAVKAFFPNVTAHLSATYGATLGKAFAFGGARIGLGLYGYLPDGTQTDLPLKKAMTVYARCVAKRRAIGGGLGYGQPCIQTTTEVSVLRAGYADGVAATKAEKQQRQVGLCMDACVVRGSLPAETALWTDAAKHAERLGVSVYEVLCAATRRAERRYVYE